MQDSITSRLCLHSHMKIRLVNKRQHLATNPNPCTRSTENLTHSQSGTRLTDWQIGDAEASVRHVSGADKLLQSLELKIRSAPSKTSQPRQLQALLLASLLSFELVLTAICLLLVYGLYCIHKHQSIRVLCLSCQQPLGQRGGSTPTSVQISS